MALKVANKWKLLVALMSCLMVTGTWALLGGVHVSEGAEIHTPPIEPSLSLYQGHGRVLFVDYRMNPQHAIDLSGGEGVREEPRPVHDVEVLATRLWLDGLEDVDSHPQPNDSVFLSAYMRLEEPEQKRFLEKVSLDLETQLKTRYPDVFEQVSYQVEYVDR